VKTLRVAALLLVLAGAASAVLADTIAYVVPSGTSGNQNYMGALGMDFDVNSSIVVTQLGVFKGCAGFDTLHAPLTAELYQRDDNDPTNIMLLATLNFTADDPGTAVDSSLFKPLPSPITLPAGFNGCIVAFGYGNAENNGNGYGSPTVAWTTNDGGGLISFVGGGRYGDDTTMFPGTVDGGPVNRYAAGTFMFNAAGGN
jgi:hypothetical protein